MIQFFASVGFVVCIMAVAATVYSIIHWIIEINGNCNDVKRLDADLYSLYRRVDDLNKKVFPRRYK